MSIQFTSRDIEILAQLGELGLLDIESIHRRHWPTGSTMRACQKRLKLYRDLGLIRNIQLIVWRQPTGCGGRLPTIQCLTERGADVVEEMTGQRPRRAARNDPKPETLQHRLAIVRTRLAVDDACRLAGLSVPDWIMEQDRRPDARRTDPPPQHRLLYHLFRNADSPFTCQPDAASLIRIPKVDGSAGFTDIVALWEIDRSSERLKQVMGKLPGYTELLEQQAYRRYWPAVQQPVVRVFWVCESRDRISNMCAAMRETPVAKVFRFAAKGDLQPQRLLTDRIWQSVDGELRAILSAGHRDTNKKRQP